ncbi:hypothetical protein [Parapedobacter defluvii]|uniref:nucleotidyltransferase domain-containing protein n=1 Tax=Parapedobacter defluvii TaxID=2045106 RepID=UPI000FBBF4C7|nr:MAG: hypothetical protein EAS52_10155 [Parapedobacter sp.]
MNEKISTIYCNALTVLQNCQCEFMIGGGYAVVHYTGVPRATKDLDIFCRPQEYPKILKCFADNGYRTELTDSRWLVLARQGKPHPFHLLEIEVDEVPDTFERLPIK